jgi:nucleotide-binding universal stress UspA family protein
MYERIIVPLDGSSLAEQVLPYVLKFGLNNSSKITLLRAYNNASFMIEESSGIDLDLITASYQAGAQDYLQRVGDVLGKAGLSISTTAQEDQAASLIVKESEGEANTLIAMSTHGRSGISRWVLGSVTEKVLHATSSPLLIVRAEAKEQAASDQRDSQEDSWTGPVVINNVTVPLDGSALAEEILNHAVFAAKALEIPITPVRVATDSS